MSPLLRRIGIANVVSQLTHNPLKLPHSDPKLARFGFLWLPARVGKPLRNAQPIYAWTEASRSHDAAHDRNGKRDHAENPCADRMAKYSFSSAARYFARPGDALQSARSASCFRVRIDSIESERKSCRPRPTPHSAARQTLKRSIRRGTLTFRPAPRRFPPRFGVTVVCMKDQRFHFSNVYS